MSALLQNAIANRSLTIKKTTSSEVMLTFATIPAVHLSNDEPFDVFSLQGITNRELMGSNLESLVIAKVIRVL